MIIEINIPEGIQITIQKNILTVKGPKGETTKEFKAKGLNMELKDKTLFVEYTSKPMGKTLKTLIENMIHGVQEPYVKNLIIRYHHFPITVELKGKELTIKNFIGERYPRKCKVHGDVKVDIKGQNITLTSCDKYAIGQTAASLKKITRSKLDERVFQDGIYDVIEE
ncbi:50S ribosomal protein L6 [Candidatus Micrarchaeota archaeon]|nr:50S ribosomal protein L6 [Candidatus Micrarchaeota archaeon]